MPNDMVVCIGDQVKDAHLGSRLIVQGVNFTYRFLIRVLHAGKLSEVPIDWISDSRGNQLIPGYNYRVTKSSIKGKTAIAISAVEKRDDFNIYLRGSGDSKVGRGKVLRDIKQLFKRETGYILGSKPEGLTFSVGDKVRMRSDWATWENRDAIKDIEMIGREGVIEKILTGNSTVRIDFNGIKKDYKLIRLVDVNGNTFEYGWNYLVTKKQNRMVAKPFRKCDRDRIGWSGNLRAR
ncbi:hypothetical protein [uncultured Marinobacter sp.]|uniref:hypothetical protein n=1 Tax=uncultured Marinobacter sp. TaxID=187379 RepID=UPI0025E7EC91|nr:hypothetical protein [uncultured Marinobacter sp.]